jgi:hypothetical protein
MNPRKIQFDTVKSVSEEQIAISSDILPSSRLLLGRELTDLLMTYMVDSQRLATLLDQHHRMTNTVDKKALEKLVGDSEDGQTTSEMYGVVFDYRTLIQNARNSGYVPKAGRLAKIEGLREEDGNGSNEQGDGNESDDGEDQLEEGMVRYNLLNGAKSGKTTVQSIIPVSRAQMRSAVSGMNAVERYRQRMGEIARLADEINGYSDRFLNRFKSMAGRPAPSLIQLSGPSKKTDTKTKAKTKSGASEGATTSEGSSSENSGSPSPGEGSKQGASESSGSAESSGSDEGGGSK